VFATRRATPRFDLKVPVRIRSLDQLGTAEHAVTSSNLSMGGIYFPSAFQLKVGNSIRLYLIMPEQIFGKPIVRWCCEGRVIHVLPSGRLGSILGVGVSFQMYAVLRAGRLDAVEEQFPLETWWPKPA
jgi:PilZ domain